MVPPHLARSDRLVHELPVMRLVQAPAVARRVALGLALLFPVLLLLLVAVPWRQAAVGTGRVIAYTPDEREQGVEAPVDGRVAEWLVGEGQLVSAGDPLVRIVDNDPDYLARLLDQREAARVERAAAGQQIASYDAKTSATAAAGELAVAEYDSKIGALLRKRVGEVAALDAAAAQEGRVRTLRDEGIASPRDHELAAMALAKHRATLEALDQEIEAVRRARDKAGQEAEAKIAAAGAEVEAARAREAEAARELSSLEITLARQESQLVRAPRDGVVLRLHDGPGGGQVSEGDVLVTIVPQTRSRAVELWLDGNDVPLVRPGQPVRVLFEGWPALQLVGLPGASRGTFGGRVDFIDSTDDGTGRFRVVVIPDEADAPWPSADLLRQGVRSKGWVLMNRVRLGFELWRQLNAFPIQLPVEEGDKPVLPSSKKPKAPSEVP